MAEETITQEAALEFLRADRQRRELEAQARYNQFVAQLQIELDVVFSLHNVAVEVAPNAWALRPQTIIKAR